MHPRCYQYEHTFASGAERRGRARASQRSRAPRPAGRRTPPGTPGAPRGPSPRRLASPGTGCRGGAACARRAPRHPLAHGAHAGVVRGHRGAHVAVVDVERLAEVVGAVAHVDPRVLEVLGRERHAAGLVGDLLGGLRQDLHEADGALRREGVLVELALGVDRRRPRAPGRGRSGRRRRGWRRRAPAGSALGTTTGRSRWRTAAPPSVPRQPRPRYRGQHDETDDQAPHGTVSWRRPPRPVRLRRGCSPPSAPRTP